MEQVPGQRGMSRSRDRTDDNPRGWGVKIRHAPVKNAATATHPVTPSSQDWPVYWPPIDPDSICDLGSGGSESGITTRIGYGRGMSDEPPPSPKLQVQIDDDIAQGVYSNLVLLNHTENEFVLDFAFIQPSNGRAKVRTRVISSPRHTKRLLAALQKNLERYEERFGTIDIGTEDEPVFH